MQIYKNKNIQLYKNTNVQIYDKYWKNGWGYWTGEEKVTWNALERRWLDFTWSHDQSAGPEAGCGTFFIEKSKKIHRQIQKNYREIQNFHSKSPPVSWTWGTFFNWNISDIFLIYSHIFWYISEGVWGSVKLMFQQTVKCLIEGNKQFTKLLITFKVSCRFIVEEQEHK